MSQRRVFCAFKKELNRHSKKACNFTNNKFRYMEYKFIQFKTIGKKFARLNIKPYISFNNRAIYINMEASKDYKDIKKIDLFIDEENGFIKIIEGSQFTLSKNGKSLNINGLSNLKMIKGKYKQVEKYIFKLNNPQQTKE